MRMSSSGRSRPVLSLPTTDRLLPHRPILLELARQSTLTSTRRAPVGGQVKMSRDASFLDANPAATNPEAHRRQRRRCPLSLSTAPLSVICSLLFSEESGQRRLRQSLDGLAPTHYSVGRNGKNCRYYFNQESGTSRLKALKMLRAGLLFGGRWLASRNCSKNVSASRRRIRTVTRWIL